MDAMKRRRGRLQKRGQRPARAAKSVLPTVSVGKVSARLHSGDHELGIVIRTIEGGQIVMEMKKGDVLIRMLKRPSGLSAALTKAFHRGKVAALNAKSLS